MEKVIECLVFLIALIGLANCATDAAVEDHPQVTISSGQIIGREIVFERKLKVFLGIPYAEPPIKELRFRKPRPLKKFPEGKVDAGKLSAACPQLQISPFVTEQSEDCLYLNVWSTNYHQNQLKPVLVWIHAGSFSFGSASEELYNFTALAAMSDVIVVSFNYRLNVLGFLNLGIDKAPGNVGIYDQQLALEWVKDNIKYFGGNPDEITIFGVSAGGWSVGLHVLSPLSRNLYKRAIMLSGSPNTACAYLSKADSMRRSLEFSEAVGCKAKDNIDETLQCLLDVPMDIIVAKLGDTELFKSSFSCIIHLAVHYGDELLPSSPKEMLATGDFKHNTQLLLGITSNEGTYAVWKHDAMKFATENPVNLTRKELISVLSEIFSEPLIVEKLQREIPIDILSKIYLDTFNEDNYDQLRRATAVAVGDALIACPILEFGRAIQKGKHNSVYSHYFDHTSKKMVNNPYNWLVGSWTGASHGSDLQYWFGHPFRFPELYTDEDKDLSLKMMGIVVKFAQSGSPPAGDGLLWPKFSTFGDQIIEQWYESKHNKFHKGMKHTECDKLWAKLFKPV